MGNHIQDFQRALKVGISCDDVTEHQELLDRIEEWAEKNPKQYVAYLEAQEIEEFGLDGQDLLQLREAFQAMKGIRVNEVVGGRTGPRNGSGPRGGTPACPEKRRYLYTGMENELEFPLDQWVESKGGVFSGGKPAYSITVGGRKYRMVPVSAQPSGQDGYVLQVTPGRMGGTHQVDDTGTERSYIHATAEDAVAAAQRHATKVGPTKRGEGHTPQTPVRGPVGESRKRRVREAGEKVVGMVPYDEDNIRWRKDDMLGEVPQYFHGGQLWDLDHRVEPEVIRPEAKLYQVELYTLGGVRYADILHPDDIGESRVREASANGGGAPSREPTEQVPPQPKGHEDIDPKLDMDGKAPFDSTVRRSPKEKLKVAKEILAQYKGTITKEPNVKPGVDAQPLEADFTDPDQALHATLDLLDLGIDTVTNGTNLRAYMESARGRGTRRPFVREGSDLLALTAAQVKQGTYGTVTNPADGRTYGGYLTNVQPLGNGQVRLSIEKPGGKSYTFLVPSAHPVHLDEPVKESRRDRRPFVREGREPVRTIPAQNLSRGDAFIVMDGEYEGRRGEVYSSKLSRAGRSVMLDFPGGKRGPVMLGLNTRVQVVRESKGTPQAPLRGAVGEARLKDDVPILGADGAGSIPAPFDMTAPVFVVYKVVDGEEGELEEVQSFGKFLGRVDGARQETVYGVTRKSDLADEYMGEVGNGDSEPQPFFHDEDEYVFVHQVEGDDAYLGLATEPMTLRDYYETFVGAEQPPFPSDLLGVFKTREAADRWINGSMVEDAGGQSRSVTLDMNPTTPFNWSSEDTRFNDLKGAVEALVPDGAGWSVDRSLDSLHLFVRVTGPADELDQLVPGLKAAAKKYGASVRESRSRKFQRTTKRQRRSTP